MRPAMTTTDPLSKNMDDKDESLILDHRAHLTPAQMVERKLVSLLKSAPVPMSSLQTVRRRLPR